MATPAGRVDDQPADPRWLAGRFDVKGELGRGGMGVVYRAHDVTLGRDVAVKTFLPGALFSPVQLERFRREGQLTAALSHPGIVRVHAAGEVEGRPWLAYELVEGARTLEEVAPTLGVGERLTLLVQVARAVAHAHARGVVHRDLKPLNVLVDDEGRPRVADFGLGVGEGLAALSRSGELLGTPTHMAPEQFLAHRGATGPATDVWALGVMLYELLTDRRPFEAQTLGELGHLVTTTSPRPPRAVRKDVAPALEAMCLRALARAPADRHADAGAFADDLERAVAAAGGRARRAPVVVIVLTLLAAAVAIGVGARARDTSGPSVIPSPAPSTAAVTSAPTGRGWFDALPVTERPAGPLPGGLRPGARPGRYLNAIDGSSMVWVPPGTFVMGEDDERNLDGDEEPLHEVTFTKGFFLGEHEVTWGQYRRFCAAARRTAPEPPFEAGEDHPVLGVTVTEARAYAAWAMGRLPTECEWEWAARGSDRRRFPWGDEEEAARANVLSEEDTFKETAPVGSFPRGASPFGVLDMAGNAWEWVDDTYGLYDAAPVVDPPPARPPSGPGLLRGGGFSYPLLNSVSHNRTPCEQDATAAAVGFRLARSSR